MGSGPLSWLHVIDCTSGRVAAAGALLAEYGADVVKIESTEHLTSAAPIRATHDRGKRSIALDASVPKDRQRIVDLAGWADVMIENWEPGVADSYGVGCATMQQRNPGLVYCSIPTWGEGALDHGPFAQEPLVDAWIGTMGEQRGLRDGPRYSGMPMASTGAAYLAVIGIIGALYRREEDGVGRHVRTSLVDGALAYLGCFWRDADVPPPKGKQWRNVFGYMKCSDGEYLGIHTGAVGGFDRLMEVLGLSDRIIPKPGDTSGFAMILQPEEAEILEHEMPQVFATRTRDEWERQLTEADICAVPAMRPGEMFTHPQVVANGMAVVVDDPELGPTIQVGVPTKFSRTPGGIPAPAPMPNQHAAELLELAGAATDTVASTSEPTDDVAVLNGVRVLDLGQYYAGPFGQRLLGDLGADVIKLEPLRGDPLRAGDAGGPAETAQFRKRSIAVDLKKPEGREIAHRLTEWADVFHHNMRPGVAERLGLGYEQLAEISPDLIYDFAPGWGGSGPFVDRQGFAPMYSGFVGASFEVAGEGNEPVMPVAHEDPGNGLLGAAGILAALVHRRRTGEGQMIEHSQLDATMSHMRHVVTMLDGTVLGTTGLDSEQLGTGPFSRLYRCADGWVCIAEPSDEGRQRLCDALDVAKGDQGPASDSALAEALERAFASRSTSDARMVLEGLSVPHEVPRLENCAAVMNDAGNHAAGRVAEWPHPKRGRVRELDRLIRISHSRPPTGRRRPAVGEHTSEVLLMVGYSPEEIGDFYERGVVASHPL